MAQPASNSMQSRATDRKAVFRNGFFSFMHSVRGFRRSGANGLSKESLQSVLPQRRIIAAVVIRQPHTAKTLIKNQ